MIVPIQKAGPSGSQGSAPGPQMADMPSEANLLMALTEMHKQGRFNRDDDDSTSNVVKLPKRSRGTA